MTDIQNEAQMQKELEKIIEKVFEVVSGKVAQKLQQQIRKDVYTEKNSWYERTGDFERSWKWGEVKKNLLTITKEFKYDPTDMNWNPKRWEHGNPGRSAVDNLADILNLAFNNYRAGYTSNMMFGDRHFSHFRRPYWENLIESLFDNGEMERMFTQEFAKYGVVKV
jgi:hypothetical protein